MMFPSPRRAARNAGLPCFLIVLASCASAPVVAPRTQVRLEPVQNAQPAAAPLAPLPSLAGDASISNGRATGPRLTSLSAENQDVGVVIRELAGKFGMQY